MDHELHFRKSVIHELHFRKSEKLPFCFFSAALRNSPLQRRARLLPYYSSSSGRRIFRGVREERGEEARRTGAREKQMSKGRQSSTHVQSARTPDPSARGQRGQYLTDDQGCAAHSDRHPLHKQRAGTGECHLAMPAAGWAGSDGEGFGAWHSLKCLRNRNG